MAVTVTPRKPMSSQLVDMLSPLQLQARQDQSWLSDPQRFTDADYADYVWLAARTDPDPSKTTNTWSALFALACIYSVVPALFKFVGMPLLWKYPLTEDKVREVQAEIAAKKAAAPTA